MKCRKCNQEFEEKDIQQHHIHPRFMDNPNGTGKKLYLCKKCHDILHQIIAKWIWEYIEIEDKTQIIDYVKRKSEEYGNNKRD